MGCLSLRGSAPIGRVCRGVFAGLAVGLWVAAPGCCQGDDRAQHYVVSTLTNDGSGGYPVVQAVTTLPGSEDEAPDLGDLDGDGMADLVASLDGQVSVFLGPSFTTRWVEIPHPSTVSFGVAIADVDTDGDLDILAGKFLSVAAFVSDGAGGFLAATSFGLPDQQPYSFAVALFDGDAWPDLVVGFAPNPVLSLEGGVAMLPGDGAGGLGSPVTTVTSEFALEVVATDFDGDGDEDIIVRGDLTLHVLENDGLGGFTKTIVGEHDGEVSAADIDGDGSPDIVLNLFRPATSESCWPSGWLLD